MKIIFKYTFYLLSLVLLTTSCGNIKYLKCKSSEKRPRKRVFVNHWLVKNSIKFVKQKYKIQEDSDNLYYSLESTILQRPDRSIVKGFRKWVYHQNDTMSVRYVFDKEEKAYIQDTVYRKQKGIKKWLHETVGSPPTVLDTNLVKRTQQSMQRLLKQKSYYDAEVSYQIKKKRHRAFVTYHVKTGMPLLIDTTFFTSKDTTIAKILNEVSDETHFEAKTPISADMLVKEKARLRAAIMERGYYDFDVRYIMLEADTVNADEVEPKKRGLFRKAEQGEPRAKVYVDVLPYSDTSITHPKFKVRNVFVIPNQYILMPHKKRIIKKDSFFIVERLLKKRKKNINIKDLEDLLPTDSIVAEKKLANGKKVYTVERTIRKVKRITLRDRWDMRPNDRLLHTILRKKYTKKKDFFLRDNVISDVVTIEDGQWYDPQMKAETLRKINNLAVSLVPHVDYVPSSSGNPYELDCYVKMQPAKKQSFGVDFEFNNNYTTVASFGIGASLNYRNKNLFKGGEIFEINGQAGVDLKVTGVDSSDRDNSLLARWINLLDVSAEANFYFPKFIGFNFIEEGLKMENTRTRISLGYRYLQQSTDFQISSIYAVMGYDWNKGRQHQFSWNPILVNFTLKPTLDPSFESLLAANNIVLLNSLQAQYLIPSMDFTYTYSSPQKKGSSWFFKSYVEISGNLLNLLDRAIQPQKPIQIFGVDYSQFFLTDFDIRYSWQISRYHSIVSRLMLGIIIPYGNSEDAEIPFTKRFTLGGPSSMRAWNLRYLGPGEQESISGAEFQVGDIRAEFNIEYRFKFNSWIGGALFADVGNIWLLERNELAQGLPYENPRKAVFTDKFYEQLGIGVGLGLRVDVSFFIFRLDYAIQLRDPQGYGYKANGTRQYWNVPFKFAGRQKFVIAIGYPF